MDIDNSDQSVSITHLSFSLVDNIDLSLNYGYPSQPHPIIVNY